jgi:CheY-like chemotaxis protein
VTFKPPALCRVLRTGVCNAGADACSNASIRDAFLDALQRADIGVVPATNAAATLELARQQRPDIVLLDDELPGIGDVGGPQKLAAEIPDSEVVVLAGRFDRGTGLGAVLAGAAGYISRGIAAEALPRIVRAVMRGETAIPRTLTTALIDRYRMLARSQIRASSFVPVCWRPLRCGSAPPEPRPGSCWRHDGAQATSGSAGRSWASTRSSTRSRSRRVKVHSNGWAISR